MSTFAPVVLFVFNRPALTKLTANSLLANYNVDNTDLFIYCDGPREEGDSVNINLVREYCKSKKIINLVVS